MVDVVSGDCSTAAFRPKPVEGCTGLAPCNPITRGWLDGRTRQARQWFASARRQLRYGEADQVLGDVTAALSLEGLPASARKTLENLYTYLEAHRDHINYARFKELGLPVCRQTGLLAVVWWRAPANG